MFITQLSVFGWLMLLVLIFSLFLAGKFSARMFKTESGCLSVGFIFVVLGCINLMFLVFGLKLAEVNIQFFKGKPYAGTVIGSKVYSRKLSNTNSYGAFYAPVVRFKDERGKLIDLESDIETRTEPKIGSKMEIVYSPGSRAQNNSATGWLFKIGGWIFVLLLGLLSYKAIRYAFSSTADLR